MFPSWFSRNLPSLVKRCHSAVLGNACNMAKVVEGIAASSAKRTMRSPAPAFSPSKPIINPAIGRSPALIMVSTDSVKELRVF